jgi:NADPH-dependent 2,4-dienoyl-CoA reductase/sulfur reductase-like enzyme
MAVSRRRFVQTALAAAAFAPAAPALAQSAKPSVVIVGGGPGGATAARYLAQTAPGELAITLIEPNPTYRTCFFQNLMIAGLHGGLSLNHTYDRLSGELGVSIVHDMVAAIEITQRAVRLASGRRLQYDRLILSPGIDFRRGSIAGYDDDAAKAMPHAWHYGQKIEALAERIRAMPSGGTFALVAPPDPYRCPPGPYERASMIATIFSKINSRAKILIIDQKDQFAKQALFEEGWRRHYGNMIEWISRTMHGGVVAVDAKAGKIVTKDQAFKVDAACVVPAQQAGALAASAGLTDATGWCPIIAATMQSTMDPNIHVIGDSSRAPVMPKSAESAANQARIAGAAVCEALTARQPDRGRIANTCWSLIAEDDGVKVGATYAPDGNAFTTTSTYISIVGEHPTLRASTYKESLGWYRFVTGQMFDGRDAR